MNADSGNKVIKQKWDSPGWKPVTDWPMHHHPKVAQWPFTAAIKKEVPSQKVLV